MYDENKSLEPKPNAKEFENSLWDLVAQLHAMQLLQLHKDIQVYKAITLLLLFSILTLSRIVLKYQNHPTLSFPSPSLVGYLIYKPYLILYNTQSTISSYFEIYKLGIC